jgi:transcriptional regulator with XRE-family HTH domain
MKEDFVRRLQQAFGGATMAGVAKRLGLPHATVRNYYQGRLPAPEVLIRIAQETGISLNWLLIGEGEMYAGDAKGIDIGKLLEAKIEEVIARRMSQPEVTRSGSVDAPVFNVEVALERDNNPVNVMREWFSFEGRQFPEDFGLAFFNGWETFSQPERIAAMRDAKRMLDRSLRRSRP